MKQVVAYTKQVVAYTKQVRTRRVVASEFVYTKQVTRGVLFAYALSVVLCTLNREATIMMLLVHEAMEPKLFAYAYPRNHLFAVFHVRKILLTTEDNNPLIPRLCYNLYLSSSLETI